MNPKLSSLQTDSRESGLKLAAELAESLHAEIDRSRLQTERPGGMNYLQPSPVSKEMIAAILFYAIAASNQGWIGK